MLIEQLEVTEADLEYALQLLRTCSGFKRFPQENMVRAIAEGLVYGRRQMAKAANDA